MFKFWSYFSLFILLFNQKNLDKLKKAIANYSKMAVILSFLMFKWINHCYSHRSGRGPWQIRTVPICETRHRKLFKWRSVIGSFPQKCNADKWEILVHERNMFLWCQIKNHNKCQILSVVLIDMLKILDLSIQDVHPGIEKMRVSPWLWTFLGLCQGHE